MAPKGIAATSLSGGNTFHSTFEFGVLFLESSLSNIRRNSAAGLALLDADAFVWYEVNMAPHYALKAVDDKLRNLARCDRPFGWKTIILVGISDSVSL